MANEVVGLDIQVRLDQLNAQLKTMGPTMGKEAKAMVAELNRAIKSQEGAVKKMTAETGKAAKIAAESAKKAATDASGAIEDLGDGAEDAGGDVDVLAQGVKKLAMGAGGDIASMAGDFEDLAEGASRVGGPLGVAAAAVAVIGAALVAAALGAADLREQLAGYEGTALLPEITDEQTQALDDIGGGVDVLSDAMSALSAQIGTAAAPATDDLVAALTNVAIATNTVLPVVIDFLGFWKDFVDVTSILNPMLLATQGVMYGLTHASDGAEISLEEYAAMAEESRARSDAAADAAERLASALDGVRSSAADALDKAAGLSKAEIEYMEAISAAANARDEQIADLEAQGTLTTAATNTLHEQAKAQIVLAEKTLAAAQAEERGKRAKDAAKISADEMTRALREQSEALNTETALATSNADAFADADAKLIEMGEKAEQAQLDGIAKVRQALKDQLAEAEELKNAALAASGESVSAQETIEADWQRTRVQLRAAADVEIETLEAKREAANEASLKRQREADFAANQTRLTQASDMVGALGDLSTALGDSLSEKNEQAAMAAYKVSKAAALVQIVIDTARAIGAANAIPFPGNIPAMAAAGLIGAAQAATVAATPPPSFGDTPSTMQMTQGGLVRLASGDKFAAAQNMDDLRAQVGGGGGAVTVVTRIGRLQTEEIIRTAERSGGRLPSMVRRLSRRSGSGVGRSGRGPLA